MGGEQVTTRFRRLLDYLRQPPHDYTPSTQQFLDLNVDKIKRELRLVEEGGRRGLSCLQHRLNELRTGIRIEIAPEGLY